MGSDLLNEEWKVHLRDQRTAAEALKDWRTQKLRAREILKTEVIQLVKIQPRTSAEIARIINVPAEEVKNVVMSLLTDGQIYLNKKWELEYND